jgi:hypothetical protein
MNALFAALGFCIGCIACLSKINQLEYEKKMLNEWLEASQKANKELCNQCDELLADLESVVNGGHIMPYGEKESKVD